MYYFSFFIENMSVLHGFKIVNVLAHFLNEVSEKYSKSKTRPTSREKTEDLFKKEKKRNLYINLDQNNTAHICQLGKHASNSSSMNDDNISPRLIKTLHH